MILIGLCGYAGTGKNTVADQLRDRHNFTEYAFADELKAMALDIDPMIATKRNLYGSSADIKLSELVAAHGWDYVKRAYPTARKFLQNLGATVRERVGEDYWVRSVSDVLMWKGEDYRAVVTDVRFPNEGAFIHAQGGLLFEVVRDGVGPVNDHASENVALLSPYIHGMIGNNATTDDLRSVVDTIANEFESLRYFYMHKGTVRIDA